MKVYYLLIPFALLSCTDPSEKTEQSKDQTENDCFIMNTGINFDEQKLKVASPTPDEIIKNIPAHIQWKPTADFKAFHYDQAQTDLAKETEKKYCSSAAYQTKFADWIAGLPEFNYLSVDGTYALAKNKYGLWIIENSNNEFKPYFLGLTQNIFLPDFYAKDQKFIQDDHFLMSGSLVDIQRLSRVPMLPKYEVLKDGVQFSIRLDDLKRDSDGDGFNDLFEKFIGLNPKSKDTDGDGISDFEDNNPKYKTGTDTFTTMYENLVDHGITKTHYSFVEILTNCEYFQGINPKTLKVLMYNTSEKVPLKDDVLDHFFPKKYSKMKTYKNYDQVYFTDFLDETGDGTISAELVNGKWKFDKKYTMEFGM